MTNTFATIAGWIEERQAANRRSGSVLITLFGDVVVPHGGAVALGSLVEAGALTGISEQTIRSSVNRLVADIRSDGATLDLPTIGDCPKAIQYDSPAGVSERQRVVGRPVAHSDGQQLADRG